MKDTGIVRRIDVLGRVVIPKEIRKTLKMNEGDPVEVYTEKDALVIKKYSPVKTLGGSLDCAAESLEKCTGHSVIVCDENTYLASSRSLAGEIVGNKITKAVEELLKRKKTLVVNRSEGGAPIEILPGDRFNFANKLFMPVMAGDETIGAIILADKSKDNPITSSDVSLAMLTAGFIAAHF